MLHCDSILRHSLRLLERLWDGFYRFGGHRLEFSWREEDKNAAIGKDCPDRPLCTGRIGPYIPDCANFLADEEGNWIHALSITL